MLRPHPPVFFETQLDVDLHEHTRATSGQKLFLAGIDDLDGLFGFAREDRGNQSVVVIAGFSAETAADGALNDANIAFAHAECRGDAETGAEQGLRVHVDRVLAVQLMLGDAADGLYGAMPLGHALESVLDD